MGMFVDFTVRGGKKTRDVLQRLAPAQRKLAAQAMYAEATDIMADSMEHYVPVRDGVLRGSGTVHQPTITASEITVAFGYGGAAKGYALKTHENPRAGKTGGLSPSGRRYKRYATTGGWKYLEQPVVKATVGMSARIAARMRDGLRPELGL
jgi:hypothetical protein